MDQNHQLLFKPADLLEIPLDRTSLPTDILPTPNVPGSALDEFRSDAVLFLRQTPPHPTPAVDWEHVAGIVQKTPPLARLDRVVY
jgi:hypothetical protein